MTSQPVTLRYQKRHLSKAPRLRNILPWPSHPTLSRSEQDSLSPMLKIELCSLPAGISETPPIDISQTDWKTYLHARALTHARRTLDELSRVCICVGGRTKGSSGRYLGIVEEAWLALKNEKPLFLLGALGGASQHLINAILGLDFDDEVLRPMPGMTELYQQCRPFVSDSEDSELASDTLINDFTACSATTFAQRCG